MDTGLNRRLGSNHRPKRFLSLVDAIPNPRGTRPTMMNTMG
jgi:hypothetical protein